MHGNPYLKNNDLRRSCFDTPGTDHYHTAPMPIAREPLLDAVVQAAQGAVVEREFPLADFVRLRDRLAEPGGVAHARLVLRTVDAVPAGALDVNAGVTLVCQRCLQPMQHQLRADSRLAFVLQESDRVPAGHDAIPGDPTRVDLVALVEDELLLALPVIARHPAGAECRLPGDAAPVEQATAPEMRRPFAGLKDLLKH
ncbi:MAG: YceD family protein [Pseudomonadota bacterium]|nr:YceD family protein [Pseudomonadota bacterium]